MADDVKGSYDATRRRAGAEEARRHLVDVAAPLFVAQGYEGTSMRNLADAAGVSVQTLYNTFGSKFGVFGAVMDVVVAGDHEPETLAERAPLRDLLELDDPASILAALVDAGTEVLARLASIFPTLRAAAASDPQVAAAYRQFVLDARHADLRVGVDRLAELGALADGTDPDAATDATWAVLSPDLFHLLVTERGWTTEGFAAWATATLTATLLAPTG